MRNKSVLEIMVYLAIVALALALLSLAVLSPHFLMDNSAVYQVF